MISYFFPPSLSRDCLYLWAVPGVWTGVQRASWGQQQASGHQHGAFSHVDTTKGGDETLVSPKQGLYCPGRLRFAFPCLTVTSASNCL